MRQLIRILVPLAFLLAIVYLGWVAYARPTEADKACPQGECDFARY